MMKACSLYLIGILFLIVTSTSAQQLTVNGKVVNEKKQPIEFINVLLIQKDSLLTKDVITNQQGQFVLIANQGNYTLVLKQFGTELLKKEIVLNSDINLGELIVNESVTLQGVVINDRKKLVEQKIDRLVFNVQNSIASQGMSGLDAIRSTPLLRVNETQGISIVGKSNVAVMVNDRMLNLSGSELTNYLQSLRSDDIARIEVITTPPSKYEAQGNSGIINIILKKNINYGWSGNVTAAYQRNSNNGYRGGAALNYQSEKLSSSLKLRQYNLTYQTTGTRNLLGNVDAIYSNDNRKDQTKSIGLNYSLDYKINARQNIGFIYDFNNQNYNINAFGKSRYEHQNVIDSTLFTNQEQLWKTPSHTLNTYYDLKLDTLGKKLTLTANYLSNIPNKTNHFNTLNEITNSQSNIKNTSKMNYGIYSVQADLTLPYQWVNLETGVKYSLLDNQSDVTYYNYLGTAYVINPANSNVFNYKEHNYSSYLSLQKDLSEKWSAKAGLRYEYTTIKGAAIGDDHNTLKNNYGKLFPTAYISYKPNNDHVFSLNYSKRINRPDFQSLNPFRWYTNPYLYFTGKPTLQPSYNDNVEFSYAFKNKLTFGLYNQYSRNNTSNIARLNDGIYSNIIENAYNQNRIGLNIGYNDTFFKILETSISTNTTYTRTTPTILEAEQLKMYSFYYSIDNTLTLNQEKTWFLMFNFWHSLPFTYANMKLQDQFELASGIKTSFFAKKLQVNAVVNDVFKTIKNQGYANNSGYRSEFNQYNDYRRFTLSLTYVFGNNKVKGANKAIKFDEQNRAN